MAVTNARERTPLLDKAIGSEPLLAFLRRNLEQCGRLDAMCIVTSDQECDSLFLDGLRSSGPLNEGRLEIETLRIPSDSPFAFNEQNKELDRFMLYRTPLYGLFSGEGFLHFTQGRDVSCAVILDANSSLFVSPELIDILIDKGAGDGEMVSLGSPLRSIVAASYEVVKELLRKRLSAIRNRFADRRRTIEKEIDHLREYGNGIGDSELTSLSEKKISNAMRKELAPLHALFSARNAEEGRASGSRDLKGHEESLLAVTSDRDLELLGRLFGGPNDDLPERLPEAQDDTADEVKRVWPSYLNIELTNNCNCGCSFCPNSMLERKRGMMDDELFRKIVVESAEYVPFVCLSGYGEPTLHPKLTQFIAYAKRKGVLRVALETNAVELDEGKLAEIFGCGLDFLIINMNAFMGSVVDWRKGLNAFIELRDAERKKRDGVFPKVILQVINSNSVASGIDHLYGCYDFIADRIVLLPFDTFGERIPDDSVIDFTPMKRSSCRKLPNTLYVYWDGTVGLCGEFFEGRYPGMSLDKTPVSSVYCDQRVRAFHDRHLRGEYPDECRKCRQWYLLDFPRPSALPWQSLISREFTRRRSRLLEEMTLAGDEYFSRGNYADALDKWEEVLSHDPNNELINSRLSGLLGKECVSLPADEPMAQD
jgi:hypothetical protein